jgi:hypothetical protein
MRVDEEIASLVFDVSTPIPAFPLLGGRRNTQKSVKQTDRPDSVHLDLLAKTLM